MAAAAVRADHEGARAPAAPRRGRGAPAGPGGEFRLDLALPELGPVLTTGGYVTQRPLVDLGVALRVSL